MAKLTPFVVLNDLGISIADIDGALAAAADTDNYFDNTGKEMLLVSNGGSSALTVTMTSIADPYGRGGESGGANDKVISVAAGKVALVPPLHIRAFNGHFKLSATTSVKIGLARILPSG